MNTQNSLGIWISDSADIAAIPSLLTTINDLEDICIITHSDLNHPDYAIISPFHISFMDIRIVFFAFKDYAENKNNLRSNRLYLFNKDECKLEEIKS